LVPLAFPPAESAAGVVAAVVDDACAALAVLVVATLLAGSTVGFCTSAGVCTGFVPELCFLVE
jgi:hypothetical protein